MIINKYLKDDKFFKQVGTQQLRNLARNLKIEINDIKYNNAYRTNLRKRILETREII